MRSHPVVQVLGFKVEHVGAFAVFGAWGLGFR